MNAERKSKGENTTEVIPDKNAPENMLKKGIETGFDEISGETSFSKS